MTPYAFGKLLKLAYFPSVPGANSPVASIPNAPKPGIKPSAIPNAPATKPKFQPLSQRSRENVLADQAKLFPNMVEMARAGGKNQVQAIPAFEQSVFRLTGTAPSNWEMHEALSAPNTGFSKVKPLPQK